MALSGKARRALLAQAHSLKARIILRAGAIDEAAVAHVRAALATQPLLKVRIQTDDRSECDHAARTLAERAGCELVRRIGRVAVLYRPQDEPGTPAEDQ